MTSPRTNQHPDFVGPATLMVPWSERLDIATLQTDAAALNCLYISYNPEIPEGGSPAVRPHAATVAVDQNGAGTNQPRINIAIKCQNASGAALSDVTFTIDCLTTGKVAWASNAATALSLKDVIDLLNEDDGGGTNGKLLSGIKCWVGPGGLLDFIPGRTALGMQELAATYIQNAGTTGSPTGFFKRDMEVDTQDSDYLVYWRIGVPEPRDGGVFKLLDLYGAIGTDTGATVYVVRDHAEDYVIPTGTWATDIANHEEVASVAASSLPAGSGGANWLEHNPMFAPGVQGPIVVIVKGDTGNGQVVNLIARLQRVSSHGM